MYVCFCVSGLLKVADSVSGKGKTDDSNGGTDNNGGHQLVQPFNACKLDCDGDNDINKTCKNCTEDQTDITYGCGSCTCKCGSHGAEECEGRAEEYGAFLLGEQDVNKSTGACTEQCRSGAHAITYDDGNDQGCSHDGKKLLDCEDDKLAEFRLIAGLVEKFHNFLRDIVFFVTHKKSLTHGKVKGYVRSALRIRGDRLSSRDIDLV